MIELTHLSNVAARTNAVPPPTNYPVFASSAGSAQNTATTTRTVTMPAGLISGDLLVIAIALAVDASITDAVSQGYTVLQTAANTAAGTVRLYVFTKTSNGAEGADEVFTGGTNSRSAHLACRITGWTGTPEVATAVTNATANAAPDSPSLTPSGGSKKYLWLAIAALSPPGGTPSYPADYTGFTHATSNLTGDFHARIMLGHRPLVATSENPAAFGVDAVTAWAATTVAIEGA